MLSGCFSLWSPKFCYCYVVFLSQHAKAATAEGLTFSDPIHTKRARNLNLYDFCHSSKKLAARRYHPFLVIVDFYKQLFVLFQGIDTGTKKPLASLQAASFGGALTQKSASNEPVIINITLLVIGLSLAAIFSS
jgi:hypothetical protein